MNFGLSGLMGRPAILVIWLLVSGGCSVGVDLQRPAPVKQTFVLEVQRTGAAQDLSRDAPSLVIGSVRVAPEFERRAFVYRMDDMRYEGDYYNQWLSSPRDQVTRATAEWMRSGNVFRDVLPPALAAQADYRLDLSVTRLYWDLRDPQRHTAEVEISAYLSTRGAPGRSIVFSTRVETREIVASASAQHRVAAVTTALEGALAALERELGEVVDNGSGR